MNKKALLLDMKLSTTKLKQANDFDGLLNKIRKSVIDRLAMLSMLMYVFRALSAVVISLLVCPLHIAILLRPLRARVPVLLAPLIVWPQNSSDTFVHACMFDQLSYPGKIAWRSFVND